MISAVVLVVLLGALAYFRAPVLAWTVGLAAWLAALQFVFHCPLPPAAWVVLR